MRMKAADQLYTINTPQIALLKRAAEDLAEVLTAEKAAALLPKRPWDGHKGTFGKVYVAGGSVGFTGAPVFAARAAARTGSGLVFLGVPKDIYPITASMCMEAMPSPLSGRDGMFSGEACFQILDRMKGCDAGLLGPGLGRSRDLTSLVCGVVKQAFAPLVLDADALYAIKDREELLKARAAKGLVTILTPHEGEFAYLGGRLPERGGEGACEKATEERMTARIQEAKAFAAECGCILVLKGPGTVTAAPDGRAYVNPTGNSGMAKGGSGDILAGMLLSLLGQGLEPVKAAALAVWLHGFAGDLCREELGEYGMLPTDMVDKIPAAIRTLEGMQESQFSCLNCDMQRKR